MAMNSWVRIGVFCVAAAASATASADDWPMWRYDAGRTAVSPGALPEKLHLQWARKLPPLQPAYNNVRLQFDSGYEPIVKDGTLFVASSLNDSVTAFEIATGDVKWRFFTDGPVRLAPVAWKDRVFFGSDDGHMYCVNSSDGTLIWKFRAVPSRRKLLGNGRLISAWPVRGGPVLAEGPPHGDVLYFAAGVWSFEGVFVYALDAQTGRVLWLNDRTGYLYGQHPHAAEAFGGLTPQGYLLVNGDELIVPCGTALPARFDRWTGELKSFDLPKQGRYPGGWFTAASKAQRRGKAVPQESDSETDTEIVFDRSVNTERHEGGQHTGPGADGIRSTITVGEREISFADKIEGVEGEIHTMLAADGKLFVVTREGGLYCFGSEPRRVGFQPARQDRTDATATQQPSNAADVEQQIAQANSEAARILRATGIRHGYALAWGLEHGRLLEELAARTDLHVVGFDPDQKKIDELRRRLDAAGVYGTRITLHADDVLDAGLPPYFASLIVSENPAAANLDSKQMIERLFHSLRPHGGIACLSLDTDQHAAFKVQVESAKLANAEVQQADGLTLLIRAGALPGATNYTGGWSSPDELVKAPLGVLWFDDSLGHFKRSPQPKFVDGVMVSHTKLWEDYPTIKPPYALGPAVFSDVYTGRIFSDTEAAVLREILPQEDVTKKQPEQYRPPTQTNAWSPQKPVIGERINPLSGLTEPRAIPKSYGCDGGIDYGFLFTHRSGTAAYYDKRLESGTVHISGPRSGCTNSVIPANGLLNVPYFYQGCTCSYPLPVGLALVHMPEEYEQWTVWGPGSEGPIQRVGINFGAPGDRMTESGTLWLDYPAVGGPSPEVAITTQPEKPHYFYHHSLRIEGGEGRPWVVASGAKGLSSVTIAGLKPGRFTVRLSFMDPDHNQPGRRVFDVSLAETPVLRDFDIAKEAGGRMRGVVKEFQNIGSDGSLRIDLTARTGDPLLCGIELIRSAE